MKKLHGVREMGRQTGFFLIKGEYVSIRQLLAAFGFDRKVDTTMANSFSIPISRRDFMKLATLSAASALLGGTLSSGKAEAAEGALILPGLTCLCSVRWMSA